MRRYAAKTRNKYGAIKTKVDGITFDSKLEAKRYGQLKLMSQAGVIDGLRTHVRYPLCTGDNRQDVVGHYEVDFVYFDKMQNKMVHEDCKGVIPALSAWKIRHFELQYGVKVSIIRK